MKIAVLCATSFEVLPVDRRVLNQCEIFANEGWDVTLVLGARTDLTDSKPYDYMNLKPFSLPITKISRDQSFGLVNKVMSIDLDKYEAFPLPKTLSLSQGLFEKKDVPNPPSVLDRYMYTFSFLNILEEVKPDAVYSADYQGMVASYLYYEKTKTPYAIDSHEFCLSHATGSTTDSKFIRELESRCFQDATALLTVSHDFRSLYMIEYGRHVNPYVYYNVPKEQQEDTYSIGDIRETLKISKDSKIVLFHGGLSLGKRNLELLLESAPLLLKDDIHILFVGYGPLVELISKLKTTNVHYGKPLNQTMLQQLVRQVNLIIVPYAALDINQLFCAPNRVFDAISTSTPIVFNERIRSLHNLEKYFGIAQSGSMKNYIEVAQSIRLALNNEAAMRTAYVENKSVLTEVYSFSTQEDTIKRVLLKLKSKIIEQRGNVISDEVKDFYLNDIVDNLSHDETYQIGIQIAKFFMSLMPTSDEALSIAPLIEDK